MMKKIPLTQGKFAIVDDEDYEYLNQWKWYAVQIGNNVYAMRTEGWPIRKNIYMHKQLIDTKDSEVIDHHNRDGLDNRKSNLRVCTKTENRRNSRKQSNNKTGYKGVSFSKNGYTANIQTDYIGRYKTAEEAARAYDREAIKRFGKFAKTNFND